jgi:hypothetical protein
VSTTISIRRREGRAKYDRLRELERTWDPENLFHLNPNLAP